MSKQKNTKRLFVPDVGQSIINVFDALAESVNMDRTMAFHCLLLDCFNGAPKGAGLPPNPYYQHWLERTDELRAHYCDD